MGFSSMSQSGQGLSSGSTVAPPQGGQPNTLAQFAQGAGPAVGDLSGQAYQPGIGTFQPPQPQAPVQPQPTDMPPQDLGIGTFQPPGMMPMMGQNQQPGTPFGGQPTIPLKPNGAVAGSLTQNQGQLPTFVNNTSYVNHVRPPYVPGLSGANAGMSYQQMAQQRFQANSGLGPRQVQGQGLPVQNIQQQQRPRQETISEFQNRLRSSLGQHPSLIRQQEIWTRSPGNQPINFDPGPLSGPGLRTK